MIIWSLPDGVHWLGPSPRDHPAAHVGTGLLASPQAGEAGAGPSQVSRGFGKTVERMVLEISEVITVDLKHHPIKANRF